MTRAKFSEVYQRTVAGNKQRRRGYPLLLVLALST